MCAGGRVFLCRSGRDKTHRSTPPRPPAQSDRAPCESRDACDCKRHAGRAPTSPADTNGAPEPSTSPTGLRTPAPRTTRTSPRPGRWDCHRRAASARDPHPPGPRAALPARSRHRSPPIRCVAAVTWFENRQPDQSVTSDLPNWPSLVTLTSWHLHLGPVDAPISVALARVGVLGTLVPLRHGCLATCCVGLVAAW